MRRPPERVVHVSNHGRLFRPSEKQNFLESGFPLTAERGLLQLFIGGDAPSSIGKDTEVWRSEAQKFRSPLADFSEFREKKSCGIFRVAPG